METLEELISLESQVKTLRLQDKLGKQNFHEDMKKVFEPMTEVIKNTSSITQSSIKNNKALQNMNEKFLELMNEKGMIAPYLASSLVNLFKPESKSQLRKLKDLNSTKFNDFLLNGGTPVTNYSNILTFRDSNKSFKLDGDLLETMTNFDFNVGLSSPNQKVIYEFGKEMNFIIKQKGRKSDRERNLIKLLK